MGKNHLKLFYLVMVIGILLNLVFQNQLNSKALTATTGLVEGRAIEYAQSPSDNPLKGFVPYEGKPNFPHSMEWFYIPLKDVQTGYNTFNWTALETRLNTISGRGNQAVLRVYLDYPKVASGIPQFLINDGLKTFQYSSYGGGISPDYKDEKLALALKSFIAEFGKRYDGDPRIAYLTAGLLGFWGEWHTYPHVELDASLNLYNEIADAYESAFKTTHVLIRYPKEGMPGRAFGYHDDSFCYETLTKEKWHFLRRLQLTGEDEKWKRYPIGGELRPEIQASIFKTQPWTGGNGETWSDCVSMVHPTWLINNEIYRYSDTVRQNAITAAGQMGYDFTVTRAYFQDIHTTNSFSLGIDIKNIGVAPFYYKWDFVIGIKMNGKVISSWSTDWDVRTVAADGKNYRMEYTNHNHNILPGEYTLSIKLVNPLINGKPLRFANVGQNQDGWLDLGTFKVNEGKETVPTPMITTTPTSIPTPTSKWPYLAGDINGDGIINSTDYVLLKRYLLGIIDKFPYDFGKDAADLNNDGMIDSSDFVILRRFILGIIYQLPFVG